MNRKYTLQLLFVSVFLMGSLIACGDSSTPTALPTVTVPVATPTIAVSPTQTIPFDVAATSGANSRATLVAQLTINEISKSPPTPTIPLKPTITPDISATANMLRIQATLTVQVGLNLTASAIRDLTALAPTPTPPPTNTPAPTPTPKYSGIILEVAGTNGIKFSGSCLLFKLDGSSSSQDAVGTVPVTLRLGGGKIVSCVLQKQGVSGQLNARLLGGEDGHVIAEGNTSQQYGVVSVSGQT